MANLVELSNQLEDFPEQQLVQMSQDPNSMYPSYLVLSEIQRRNQMRKMYEAQQPKPETTVAEEVIGEFTGQQGLQGAMAQSPGPQDAFPPSDMSNMAPPSPMQMMASGGKTSYETGGLVDNFLSGDYGILGMLNNNPELMFGAAGLAAKNNFRGSLLGELYNQYKERKDNKKIEETEETIEAMASGGRTGYQTGGSLGLGGDSLAGTFTNPNEVSIEEKDAVDKNIGQLYQQYGAPTLKAIGALNEDGSINYVGSALALASINPAIRLGKGVIGLGGRAAQKFAPKLLEKGKNLITKPGVKIQNPALKTGVQYGDDVIDPKTGAKIKQVITGPRTLKIPSTKGLLRGAGNLALPSLVVGNLIESGMERKAIEKEEARLLAEQKAAKQEELLAEQEAKIAAEKAKQEAAIQAQIKKEKEQKQADMLVGLGGAIMSAKNIGELGTGISDVYTGIQTREDAKSLTGLQGRLLQAQASQIEANIAGMDLKELQASAKIIGDGLENGALTVEEYGPTFQAIANKIALLQGLQPKLGGETILAANERVSGGN